MVSSVSESQQRPAQLAETIANAGAGLLLASAQILTFDPGSYSVEFHGVRSVSIGLAFPLPCARLDPMPFGGGRAIVASLSEGGWISSADAMLFLRVLDDSVNMLLTTYRRFRDDPAPELRIRAVDGMTAIEKLADGSRFAGAATATPAKLQSDSPLLLIAHVERLGDVKATTLEWAGSTMRDCALEGFAIEVRGDLSDVQIEYQAMLGQEWDTPWTQGGEFCGSRGMSLPLRGYKVRLAGETAKQWSCLYWGIFVGGEEVGPVAEGKACAAGGKSLVAMRITLVPVTESLQARRPRRSRRQESEQRDKQTPTHL